MSTGCGI